MLSLAGLRKRFGHVTALDGVAFDVPRGRIVGFLGPNGAGKTTTMRSIFGLVALDEGDLSWEGRPIGEAERTGFGYMPEERGLYAKMPAVEQLVYLGRLHGLAGTDAREAAQAWLDRLGLGDRAATPIERLSHGNQQRVQLAAALVHRPGLLVLDEPFAGLDPLAVETLADVLRGEADRGAAVLFSSHQLELVEDLCEDVAIVARGRIVASGGVAELREAQGRLRIDLTLEGAPPDWLPSVPGVDLLERQNGSLRLLTERAVDPAAVLAQARAVAQVGAFSFGPPSLAELFLEKVKQ